MNGTAVIQMLLNGSFNMIQERLEAMTDEEWSERALPATSKLGFILRPCGAYIRRHVLLGALRSGAATPRA